MPITFVKIPIAILKECTPNEIAVYGAFSRFARIKTRRTVVSVETVSKLLRVHKETVEKALTGLNKKGWMSTMRRGKGKTAERTVYDTGRKPLDDTGKSPSEKEKDSKERAEPENSSQDDPAADTYASGENWTAIGNFGPMDDRIQLGLVPEFKPGGRFAKV